MSCYNQFGNFLILFNNSISRQVKRAVEISQDLDYEWIWDLPFKQVVLEEKSETFMLKFEYFKDKLDFYVWRKVTKELIFNEVVPRRALNRLLKVMQSVLDHFLIQALILTHTIYFV